MTVTRGGLMKSESIDIDIVIAVKGTGIWIEKGKGIEIETVREIEIEKGELVDILIMKN